MLRSPFSMASVLLCEALFFIKFICVFGTKPEISALHFPSELRYGKRTAVVCTVIDGDPPFTFSWLKDGLELKETPELMVIEASDGFTSTLSISKLEAQSNGNYTCRVRNRAGLDEKHGMLLVKELISELPFNNLNVEISIFPCPSKCAFLRSCVLPHKAHLHIWS